MPRTAEPSRKTKPRKTTSRKTKSARPPIADAAAEIYSAVAAIPRGKVATYGQLAELIGMPRGHRVVARAMRTCPSRLPWHRVVGRKDARRAQISIGDPEHASIQRKRLATEGVVFDASGFIVLRKSGWLPS